MVDPLAGVDAKTRRGFDHLEELHLQMRAFFATNPYTVVDTRSPETGWHHITVRVEREPPIELGIIVGDAVGQFRSALDHLLTQATRLNRPGTHSLNFPICVERAAFSSAPPKRRSIESQLRAALRAEHLVIVKRHQPFEQDRGNPRSMPLAALNYLSNVDKHEIVHAAYSTPQTSMIADAEDAIWHRPPIIENGTELGAYLPHGQSDVETKAVITIGVAFGRESIYREVMWGSLHMIGAWVARIVEEFRAVTPEFQPSPYPRITVFKTPNEAEEARRSFVGSIARAKGQPYYEFDAKGDRIFHLNPECPAGKAIPDDRIRAGMGRPRLCSRCGRMPTGFSPDRAFTLGSHRSSGAT